MEVFISALPKGVRQVKPEEAAEKTEKTEVKEPKAAKDKKEAPTKASVAEVAEKKPKKAVKPIKKVKGAKKTAAGAKGRVWERFLLAGPWREAEIMLQFDQQLYQLVWDLWLVWHATPRICHKISSRFGDESWRLAVISWRSRGKK